MEFIYHFIYHVIEYWILNTRISTAGAQSKTVDLTENSMSSCARRWRFGRRRRSAVVLRLHRHGCFSWIWTIWKAERNVRTKRAQLLYMSSILYTYMIIYVYIYMYIEVFFFNISMLWMEQMNFSGMGMTGASLPCGVFDRCWATGGCGFVYRIAYSQSDQSIWSSLYE